MKIRRRRINAQKTGFSSALKKEKAFVYMYICIWKSCVQRWSLPYLSGLLFDLFFFSSKEEEGDGGSVANGGDHYVSVPPIFTMRDFLLLYREKLLTVQSLLSAALYIDRSIWGTHMSTSSLSLVYSLSSLFTQNPSGLFIFLFFPYRLSDLVTTSWAAHLIDCNTPHHSKSNKVGVHTIHDPLW